MAPKIDPFRQKGVRTVWKQMEAWFKGKLGPPDKPPIILPEPDDEYTTRSPTRPLPPPRSPSPSPSPTPTPPPSPQSPLSPLPSPPPPQPTSLPPRPRPTPPPTPPPSPSAHSPRVSAKIETTVTLNVEQNVSNLQFAWPNVSCMGFPTRGSLAVIACHVNSTNEEVDHVSSLQFAWPEVLCVTGFPTRGCIDVIASCVDSGTEVGIYYEEALAALTVAPPSQHFDKTWVSHVQLKASLFYAEACYRYSLELHEKEEIAQEIARLKSGITALSEVKKTAKGPLLDAVNKLEVSLNRNLERAMKENDRVYLQRVPPASSLPPLPAYSMVKPLPLDDVLDASKEKMFLSLVPDSSTKALSKYTEMLDHVIRTQAEKLQQGSELARVRLKEMDLPDSLLSLEGNSSLPENLKEDVEAVQISGGPAGLEAELQQQLRDLRRVNQELLVQTEELLQKETQEDSQFRSQFGTRWTRPQSSTLTKNLQDRLNRFAGNLKQTGDSDVRIERSVKDHSALMSILDRHLIEAARPTLAKPIMSLDSNEDAIVGALKQTLRHLETLGAQRAGLEDMLKEMKRKDDILPKLMTATVSYEDLFKKEISKYDHICEEIAQNLEAQERLLIQIQFRKC